jgi:hypothetical protein
VAVDYSKTVLESSQAGFQKNNKHAYQAYTLQSPPWREWLLASSKAFKTVSYLELKLTPTILWTLWTNFAAVAYSEAVLVHKVHNMVGVNFSSKYETVLNALEDAKSHSLHGGDCNVYAW